MDKQNLKAIFIEEAGEIIERLDSDIIDFEQNQSNKELLNALFRGVHTLKGSANAFGFSRLGGFVHHFEDMLDEYRSPHAKIPSNAVDVMLDGVDVIKEVMSMEVNGEVGLPDKYEQCLQNIIGLLNKIDDEKSNASSASVTLSDLSVEFVFDVEKNADSKLDGCDELFDSKVASEISNLSNSLLAGYSLFKIELSLDNDIYFRGYDHIIFLKLLAECGNVKSSFWECGKVPPIEAFDSQNSYFSKVVILLESQKSKSDLEELFEFIFDTEYSVALLDENKIKQDAQIKIQNPASSESKDVTAESQKLKSETQDHLIVAQKSYIKIDTQKLDELFDSVGELVIAQNYIAQNEKIKELVDTDINRTIETLSKITRLIQDRVMSLRMVAIRDTFEKMKRVARDTAKKTGKEIKLIIYGEDTEIDKTMIDSLSDPMIHLIRNAIDHGLEIDGDDRIKAGKNPEGAISLKAFHKNGNIVISISDDGRGIDRQKVLEKAYASGLIQSMDGMSDQQIYSLLLQPGFSTASSVSDISGRGVGLDVVKTSIDKLRGKIEITSSEGEGSSFSIILPLTLAIIDGMLVKSSNDIFIIPTLSVVESFRPDKEIVHMLKGKGEFVDLRSEHIPVVRLNEFMGIGDERPDIWESTLVCIETDKGRYAILVDELLGRQQVVIKSLGRSLSKIKEISGGAILGNGDIALILNVDSIFEEHKLQEKGQTAW